MLGLLDGGLNALPSGSVAYWCGKNTTNMRLDLAIAAKYFGAKDTDNGMKEINTILALANPICVNCFYGFYDVFQNGATWTWNYFLTNILHNIGFMYQD